MIDPVEPPPSPWTFPDPHLAPPGQDLVALGADIEPGTLLAAQLPGCSRCPDRKRLGWWSSPDPRGIMPLVDGLHVSRSLRRSLRTFTVTRDRAFERVMVACGDPRRKHGWITPRFVDAYTRLHRLGWASSVEVWSGERLVGGVYGVRIGGFFAGESMFHTETDASKVALVDLVGWLGETGARLFDVQWTTDHLRSLGAVDVSRAEYLARLADAVGAGTTAQEESS